MLDLADGRRGAPVVLSVVLGLLVVASPWSPDARSRATPPPGGRSPSGRRASSPCWASCCSS
ncbi:hypothetical protein BJF88_00475 [Cellulosimicrobium sp. CUA-896]|nr:hypothetical protein BJF88_00475 [Cellulosimicrobium sp. CUA-896]